MNSDIVSRPYDIRADKCCERCAFNTGEHEPWCEEPARERFNRALAQYLASEAAD